MVAAITRGRVPTQAEFHRAVARRADRWYSACLRITRSPELAEDAVQEALLTAWDKRDQFRGTSRLETWIHSIAVNAALQLLRKQRPGVFLPLEIDPQDDGNRPEDDRQQYDVGTRLDAAMTGLTAIERVCFALRHLEQWRIREIAEELDTSESNVKQAIFRGVKKLRVTLGSERSVAS